MDNVTTQPMDEIDSMVAWESGRLGAEAELELFRKLLKSGLLWELQGCYGRRARELGLI
jgi:hypothetical protein